MYKAKKIKTNPEYNYFIIGLTAKLFGGIGFALFSIYYYKGGDTFMYFNAGKGLMNYFFENFSGAVDVIFTGAKELDIDSHNFTPRYSYIMNTVDVLSLVKITSLINLISFGSYLVASIFFAFFSFCGLWLAYSNFCKLYPTSSKYMLIAFLLIPTALLWSSGILKDTVTQGSIGFLLYAFSNVFIFKRKLLSSIIITIIGVYVLFLLKPYILYILIPCLFVWVQTNVKNIIPNSLFRTLLKPLFFVGLISVGFFLLQNISGNAGKYDIEKVGKTLEGFQSWHGYLAENRDQSGYSLGHVEFTPLGMLKKAPAALNVTLFRPYLWEARNIPTLLGAIEGLFVFGFFIYLLGKTRLKFFKILFTNKEVLFMMLFAVVFGVVVGISSYNFGALSRYKIPSVMFFVLSLIIIQHECNKKKS